LRRDAMHTRDLCRRVVSVLCASVCLSVRPSRSCIFSKRISLEIIRHRVIVTIEH